MYLHRASEAIPIPPQETCLMRNLILSLLLTCCVNVLSQPAPGDLFKEYRWFNESGDCNGALRVGGNLDYQIQKTSIDYLGEGLISPPFDLDLEHAIRAELLVEKMLCHEGTEGLRVQINQNSPLPIPEPEQIPRPRSSYAYHYNAVIEVDLSQLREGQGNSFSFEVDTAGHWWPQNLVYGMILRIYYEPSLIESRAKISFPVKGDRLGIENPVTFHIPPEQSVRQIDLVGHYEDVDLEGDGLYRKWHYGYHKCQIYNHIGSITDAPYSYFWNTGWLPDQDQAIQLAAFVHTDEGYSYMTESVDQLKLRRRGISVELCKPYQRPRGWFTRNGEFAERFQVKGDLKKVKAAKMVFRSWSPGYFNGIYINDFIVFTKEGPKYDYFEHHVPLKELHCLKQGKNILKTGQTPLYPEGMVHGVEVQWPGIMLLIQYDTSP